MYLGYIKRNHPGEARQDKFLINSRKGARTNRGKKDAKYWKKTSKQTKKSQLTRRNKMMDNLIGSLENFKALMEFKGKCFEAES